MNATHWLKVTVVGLLALQASLATGHAQRRGLEAQVYTGTPPGLIKRVEIEFPPDVVLRNASGKGVFRLTINPKTGEVDQVKIIKRCPYKILNELAAKGLLQWRFQPGTQGPVDVPVDFYIHGGQRTLH